MGKSSGADSITAWLADLGLEPPADDAEAMRILVAVKAASIEKRGTLTPDEFCQIAERERRA